jgi:tetratricopeptide (TPR) repeat protein
MKTLEPLQATQDDARDAAPVLGDVSHTSEPRFFTTPKQHRLICCLLLALATLVLYNPITRAPFLNFDDTSYFVDNPHVHAGLSWKTVKWAFTTTELSDWKPITWLSHTLDAQLFGFKPEAPHTINILLHAANAVVLFLILLRATGCGWRSLGVAALFALHPINVESVAWIAERKNVLSMLFFLLALAAYGWYVRSPGVARYLAVTLAFALALMTKAQVITFPFALLLLDYWPLNRLLPERATDESVMKSDAHRSFFSSAGRLVWEKLPWFAMSAASAVITMWAESDATQVTLARWAHLANAALSYAKYLGKTFWPLNLAAIYPHPELSISIPTAIASAILIVIISTIAIFSYRNRPFFVGWFWFLGTMVPMIGLVQIGVHGMADRYAYIPLLGIFVILCWGAAELTDKWRVPVAARAIGAALVLIALAFALHRQVGYWGDNVTLWRRTIEVTDGNYMAEDNLATALISQGKTDEAVPHLRRAEYLRPDDPLSTLNLATYEQMRGNYPAAIAGYAKVPQCTKDASLLAMARVNSGYAHYWLQQFSDARSDFEAGLRWQPGNSGAYRGLGLTAQKAGNIPQAVQNYQRAAELEPTPSNFLFLAQALKLNHQPEAASAAESQAAQFGTDLRDDLATVNHFLGN